MNTKGQHISSRRRPEAEAKFGWTRISIGQPAGTTDLTAHLGGTDMQSDKATDDKPAKAEPPRCPYCDTTEAPIFVRAHLECPKCHTVIESCCDGGRCG
ncbi:hypothetical protein OAF52_02420 [bacterium]|nr:hypothetical protein [bacterium]